jgi:hypothetical protein
MFIIINQQDRSYNYIDILYNLSFYNMVVIISCNYITRY